MPTPVTPELRQPGRVLGARASRTIAAILDATRQIFLARGYAGTTIDDIARAAGMSRASFYTYFPSKRDVLLTLGANAARDAGAVVDGLAALGPGAGPADLEHWVEDYFAMLDEHGSFAFAWTQAAHDDHELLTFGMRGHLALCRRMGEAMAVVSGLAPDAAAAADRSSAGLAAFAMLERSWAYCQLYGGQVDPAAVHRSVARMLVPPA